VAAADGLYAELTARGVEVLFDDRDERPGVKFKDADLLGIPLRVTLGKKSLEQGKVELKARSGKDVELIDIATAADEIAARVKAVLRRADAVASMASQPPPEAPRPLRVGPVVLDLSRHEVRCHDAALKLTVTEFGLLASLMERPGVVLSRAQLMERAYAYDNLITERTIDTHVKRVRRKFRDAGHDPIETVHGVGYKLREA